MSNKDEIIKILNDYPQYQDLLFARGYLITDKYIELGDGYPFYNEWKKTKIGIINNNRSIYAYVHKLQDFYIYSEGNISISMIGHAYNPFNMVYDENVILKELYEAYSNSLLNFFEIINELTGVHLVCINDNGKLILVQDCAGLKSCYFGMIKNYIAISSHSQLIGDLFNLERNPFIEKLVETKAYNIGNRHLPGNMTPYKELKRLGGNTYSEYLNSFVIKRFYPMESHEEVKTQEQYDDSIKKLSTLLANNIKLTSLKWDNPAISLTGGTDSKTTLASANGIYDQFKYFSFHCKPAEVIDAKAAREICNKLGLEHEIYPIPDENEEIEDFEVLKKIIDHNTSYFKNTADHEIRKMIVLYRLNNFDIEVKSWVSETARVFLERKYEITMPEEFSERHLSIFQTRYFLNPKLLKKSDEIYIEFMQEISFDKQMYNYEHADLYYWEIRMGAWGTSVVSSLDFCHNATVPYNNRKIIELFLTFSHEDRKLDKVHQAIMDYNNNAISNMHIDVKNNYFKSYRIYLEKIYFYYRTLFYKSKN